MAPSLLKVLTSAFLSPPKELASPTEKYPEVSSPLLSNSAPRPARPPPSPAVSGLTESAAAPPTPRRGLPTRPPLSDPPQPLFPRNARYLFQLTLRWSTPEKREQCLTPPGTGSLAPSELPPVHLMEAGLSLVQLLFRHARLYYALRIVCASIQQQLPFHPAFPPQPHGTAPSWAPTPTRGRDSTCTWGPPRLAWLP